MRYVKADATGLDWAYGLMKDAAADFLAATLSVLGMEEGDFARLFRSVGEVMIARFDGDDIGFYWIERRENTLHIHGIVVDEPFRRQGHGRKMLQDIETAHTQAVTAIELGVQTTNSAAIALYEKVGFRVVATRDDVGFHIMQKRLLTKT